MPCGVSGLLNRVVVTDVKDVPPAQSATAKVVFPFLWWKVPSPAKSRLLPLRDDLERDRRKP